MDVLRIRNSTRLKPRAQCLRSLNSLHTVPGLSLKYLPSKEWDKKCFFQSSVSVQGVCGRAHSGRPQYW